jgi:hypothetical protein
MTKAHGREVGRVENEYRPDRDLPKARSREVGRVENEYNPERDTEE